MSNAHLIKGILIPVHYGTDPPLSSRRVSTGKDDKWFHFALLSYAAKWQAQTITIQLQIRSCFTELCKSNRYTTYSRFHGKSEA
jgi:hypothetical protein